tara:strand:- start:17000 stop:17335 length:336 start_codon:yes stop_codon:yes gene_type:complete
MAKETKTTVETVTDPPKQRTDPAMKLKFLMFWSRLIITVLAMGLFGYLASAMLTMKEEMTSSSKDVLLLMLGAFLPIVLAISKFWLDPDDSHPGANGNEEEQEKALPEQKA